VEWVASVADGPHFNQQGWHVNGSVNNAETIINNGADPHSIADGLALDRQRQRDALASQRVDRHFEQYLLRQRQMEERAARRVSTGGWVAIGVGGFIAFFIASAILLDLALR